MPLLEGLNPREVVKGDQRAMVVVDQTGKTKGIDGQEKLVTMKRHQQSMLAVKQEVNKPARKGRGGGSDKELDWKG